jgi:hypothetical protein
VTAAYPPIAWNSPGEREQARSGEAQMLALSRISNIAGAVGGHLRYRPEQARRTGDLVTYQFTVTVRLRGDQGPLPWPGPVTENETRGPDNGIPPSFGRLVHGELTVDLSSVLDAVAALRLPLGPAAGGLRP